MTALAASDDQPTQKAKRSKRELSPDLVLKTLEFKLDLNMEQQQQIDCWLKVQERVWNDCLHELKKFDRFSTYNSHDKKRSRSCPVPWSYRKLDPDLPWSDDNRVAYSPICVTKEGQDPVYACPIPQTEPEWHIIDWNKKHPDSEYSLRAFFAHNRPGNEWLKVSGCPYKMTQGTITELAEAWGKYKTGKGGIPRFKGRNNPMRTLTDNNSGKTIDQNTKLPKQGTVKITGDYIQLLKLKKRVKIKSAKTRWLPKLPIDTYHITRKATGYYLTAVGTFPRQKLKPSDKACGIDPGVKAAITLDDERQIAPANPLKKQVNRLKRLQRKLERQQKFGNGWKKTKQLIARTHEKIARSRNAFNHKLTTKLVREYGAIAVENTQVRNMVKAPKPQPREDGKGWKHNKAKAKAGLNRSLLTVAIGDIIQKLETKCKHQREFDAPPAPYSSQECHACHEKGDRRSQAEFICLNEACSLHGLVQSADGNAAKNHLQNASFFGRYRAWAWELKRETAVSSPPSGTTPATGETVSQSGVPEATTDASAMAVAPRRELSSPITTLSEKIDEPKAPDRWNADSIVPQKGRKRRSAKSTPEMPIQLSLWDSPGEIDFQSG